MKYFGDALSGLHKELNAAIRKPDQLERAKRLFLEIHSRLHLSSMTGTEKMKSIICSMTLRLTNTVLCQPQPMKQLHGYYGI